jgi:hypothetical protein
VALACLSYATVTASRDTADVQPVVLQSPEALVSLCWASDRLLLAGDKRGDMYVYAPAEQPGPLVTFPAAASADSAVIQFCTRSDDGRVAYAVRTNAEVMRIDLDIMAATVLAALPAGTAAAATGALLTSVGDTLFVLASTGVFAVDTDTGRQTFLQLLRSRLSAFCLDPAEEFLVVASDAGDVVAYSRRASRVAWSRPRVCAAGVTALAADQAHLYVGGRDGVVTVLDFLSAAADL